MRRMGFTLVNFKSHVNLRKRKLRRSAWHGTFRNFETRDRRCFRQINHMKMNVYRIRVTSWGFQRPRLVGAGRGRSGPPSKEVSGVMLSVENTFAKIFATSTRSTVLCHERPLKDLVWPVNPVESYCARILSAWFASWHFTMCGYLSSLSVIVKNEDFFTSLVRNV